MNIKSINKTKTASLILLFHVAYVALSAIFTLIAGLLEAPCDRAGLYTLFAGVSISLLCFYPLAATGINATSLFFQISALRNRESKIHNVIMAAITILLEAAVIIVFAWFWQRNMGV